MKKQVKLINGKWGGLYTKWEDSTQEYRDNVFLSKDEEQLCCGYDVTSEYTETVVLDDSTDDDNTCSILFGLFETGQVDEERFLREFEFPSGKVVKL
jgi:hypothetical protein